MKKGVLKMSMSKRGCSGVKALAPGLWAVCVNAGMRLRVMATASAARARTQMDLAALEGGLELLEIGQC